MTPAVPTRHEGRIAIVTKRGMGCGGRGSVGRECFTGRLCREWKTTRRTNGASTPSPKLGPEHMAGRSVWLRSLRTAKSCGPGIRCWCQAGGGEVGPTGFDEPLIRTATVARRNSSPGRARRKPLKPLRGESRVISGVLVVTTLCLLPMHRGCGCSGHPAFPAPSLRGTKVGATSGASRRENAIVCLSGSLKI